MFFFNGFVVFSQYDDGIHGGYMDGGAGSMYDPHVAHRGLGAHHSPHMNHAAAAAAAGMHGYHAAAAAAAAAANHVSPVANHVMGAAATASSVPDVHKRDKDAIYG